MKNVTIKYRFSFTGRQAGAIGIFYKIIDTYKCNDIHEAMSLLYEDYEHIQGVTATENGRPIDIPATIKWVKVRKNSERERMPDGGSYKYTRSDSATA